MKWSFTIGRIFGIPIRVHLTFLLLLLFVALNRQGGILSGLMGVMFILLVFAGVLLHELGHSLVARHYGEKVHDIMLLPIGGVSRTEIPEQPKQEIVMAVIGPAISLALAGVFFVLSEALGYSLDFKAFVQGQGSISQNLIPILYYVNLMLGLFNLAPAFPMDGGRVFRGLLAMAMDPIRATRIAVGVGQLIAIAMFFFGIFYNWWLALIAIFLYFGAEAEEQGTLLRRVLHQVPANAVMLEKFESVSPGEDLGKVMQTVCHSGQDDFPVVDNHNLVGLLPRNVIFQALTQLPPETRVGDIMVKDFYQAGPGEFLDKIFEKLSDGSVGLVPVVDSDRLVGILTLTQIAKYQMFCGAKPQERLSRLRNQGR